MIKSFIYYFDEYQKIVDSYRGKRTDWNEKSIQMGILVKNILGIEVRYCKNHRFYNWLKRALADEIENEHVRVTKLAKDHIRKGDGKDG